MRSCCRIALFACLVWRVGTSDALSETAQLVTVETTRHKNSGDTRRPLVAPSPYPKALDLFWFESNVSGVDSQLHYADLTDPLYSLDVTALADVSDVFCNQSAVKGLGPSPEWWQRKVLPPGCLMSIAFAKELQYDWQKSYQPPYTSDWTRISFSMGETWFPQNGDVFMGPGPWSPMLKANSSCNQSTETDDPFRSCDNSQLRRAGAAPVVHHAIQGKSAACLIGGAMNSTRKANSNATLMTSFTSSVVCSFDGTDWFRAADLPAAVLPAAAVSHQGYLFVFRGSRAVDFPDLFSDLVWVAVIENSGFEDGRWNITGWAEAGRMPTVAVAESLWDTLQALSSYAVWTPRYYRRSIRRGRRLQALPRVPHTAASTLHRSDGVAGPGALSTTGAGNGSGAISIDLLNPTLVIFGGGIGETGAQFRVWTVNLTLPPANTTFFEGASVSSTANYSGKYATLNATTWLMVGSRYHDDSACNPMVAMANVEYLRLCGGDGGSQSRLPGIGCIVNLNSSNADVTTASLPDAALREVVSPLLNFSTATADVISIHVESDCLFQQYPAVYDENDNPIPLQLHLGKSDMPQDSWPVATEVDYGQCADYPRSRLLMWQDQTGSLAVVWRRAGTVATGYAMPCQPCRQSDPLDASAGAAVGEEAAAPEYQAWRSRSASWALASDGRFVLHGTNMSALTRLGCQGSPYNPVCAPCTVCNATSFVKSACTPEADTVCAACKTCKNDEAVIRACDRNEIGRDTTCGYVVVQRVPHRTGEPAVAISLAVGLVMLAVVLGGAVASKVSAFEAQRRMEESRSHEAHAKQLFDDATRRAGEGKARAVPPLDKHLQGSVLGGKALAPLTGEQEIATSDVGNIESGARTATSFYPTCNEHTSSTQATVPSAHAMSSTSLTSAAAAPNVQPLAPSCVQRLRDKIFVILHVLRKDKNVVDLLHIGVTALQLQTACSWLYLLPPDVCSSDGGRHGPSVSSTYACFALGFGSFSIAALLAIGVVVTPCFLGVLRRNGGHNVLFELLHQKPTTFSILVLACIVHPRNLVLWIDAHKRLQTTSGSGTVTTNGSPSQQWELRRTPLILGAYISLVCLVPDLLHLLAVALGMHPAIDAYLDEHSLFGAFSTLSISLAIDCMVTMAMTATVFVKYGPTLLCGRLATMMVTPTPAVKLAAIPSAQPRAPPEWVKAAVAADNADDDAPRLVKPVRAFGHQPGDAGAQVVGSSTTDASNWYSGAQAQDRDAEGMAQAFAGRALPAPPAPIADRSELLSAWHGPKASVGHHHDPQLAASMVARVQHLRAIESIAAPPPPSRPPAPLHAHHHHYQHHDHHNDAEGSEDMVRIGEGEGASRIRSSTSGSGSNGTPLAGGSDPGHGTSRGQMESNSRQSMQRTGSYAVSHQPFTDVSTGEPTGDRISMQYAQRGGDRGSDTAAFRSLVTQQPLQHQQHAYRTPTEHRKQQQSSHAHMLATPTMLMMPQGHLMPPTVVRPGVDVTASRQNQYPQTHAGVRQPDVGTNNAAYGLGGSKHSSLSNKNILSAKHNVRGGLRRDSHGLVAHPIFNGVLQPPRLHTVPSAPSGSNAEVTITATSDIAGLDLAATGSNVATAPMSPDRPASPPAPPHPSHAAAAQGGGPTASSRRPPAVDAQLSHRATVNPATLRATPAVVNRLNNRGREAGLDSDTALVTVTSSSILDG